MDRRCTDKLMCIIFFIFFCGMFAVAAYGFKNGSPSRLVTPFDSDGKIKITIILCINLNITLIGN
jgi:hypothetical protein